MKLIWHFTANQLQRIEDLRQGKEPWFQIRSRLTYHAQWLNTDGTPHAVPTSPEKLRRAFSHSNMYPDSLHKIDHPEDSG